MKIHIVDNIWITSDTNNIIINRELVYQDGNRKGEKYLKETGYYPNVVQALESVLNEKMSESRARTLNGLVDEHLDLVMMFESLLGEKLYDITAEQQNEMTKRAKFKLVKMPEKV